MVNEKGGTKRPLLNPYTRAYAVNVVGFHSSSIRSTPKGWECKFALAKGMEPLASLS